MVKIAIIGCGNIAESHINAYKKNPNAEVVAICDINEKALGLFGDRHGIDRRYTSVEELLAKETELDAADVCTWNCNHAKCSIAASKAGLHVLCEKPMATSAEEAEEMLAAAKEAGKLLMVEFSMRFGNNALITKDYIDKGFMGDIYYTKATYLRDKGTPGGWFRDKERSGGGTLLDIGVHVLDLTRYFMGNPKPVSVYAATYDKLGPLGNVKNAFGWMPLDSKDSDPCNVEDLAIAMIRYENGAVTMLETSYSLYSEPVTACQVFGTKGGASCAEGKPLKFYTQTNDLMVEVNPKINAYTEATSAYDNFIDCIENGAECLAPAEDGVVIMKLLDAIYESAKLGREVVL